MSCHVMSCVGTDADDIIRAAAMNDVPSVKQLLKSGVDSNARCALGWSAMHVAAFRGATE